MRTVIARIVGVREIAMAAAVEHRLTVFGTRLKRERSRQTHEHT